MARERRVPVRGDLPPPAFVRDLAAALPVHQLRRAVSIALALPDVALRAEFIRALRDRLDLSADKGATPASTSSVDVAEAEDARAFRRAYEAASAIVEPGRLAHLVGPVRLIRFAPEFVRWLAPLASADPTVPPTLESGALHRLLSDIADEAVRARVLALLAPLAPVDGETFELAAGIRDGWLRVTALAALAMRMPGNATRAAVAAAESIEEPAARVTAVATLAPYLAYAMPQVRTLVGGAFESVGSIPNEHRRARALAALAPALRGFFPELAERALAVASELRPRKAREAAVEALILPWPQPYIPDAEGDWQSDSAVWTRDRLAGVLANEGDEAADDVLRDIVVAIGPETDQTPPMDRGGGEQSAEPGIVDDARKRRGFAPVAKRRERYVNLGFAPPHRPASPLGTEATLAAYYDYLFWLEIGERQKDSIVTRPAQLLPGEDLPAGAKLSVVLFDFPGGIAAFHGGAVGEMVVGPDGAVEVLRQPDDGAGREYHDVRRHRLFFRVRAPALPGVARLRCNIYHEQNLVQSYLVRAQVTRVPQSAEDALAADLDYTVARTLDAAHLRGLARHKLSIMLNRNDDGTHAFMFLGGGATEDAAFRQLATLTAAELQNLIGIGRSALRKAAWGTDKPWNENADVYRYAGPPDRARLAKDVKTLARAGYRLYVRIVKELAGGRRRADELAALMRSHGLVQIALKERPEHVFPAALMYDHPLDTNVDLALCPTFLQSLEQREPLEAATCFTTGCPSHGDVGTVCPSGFWGYRHALGLPVSTRYAPPVPTEFELRDGLEFVAAVSTDPRFVRRVDHLERIRTQCGPARWTVADTRTGTLTALKQSHPHLVYFYCHGGVTADRIPFLIVGPPTSQDGIASDNFNAHAISWDSPRPIVFLNGCHTTALEPESAISFVTTLVEDCAATGVVGTEITIFEPLACRFAEECLTRFFVDRLPFGEAIRRARLALLAEANPLGLVYIPYVQTGLHIA